MHCVFSGRGDRRRRRHTLLSPPIEALEPRQLLSTYYVSPSGNNANSGTSTSAPWSSLSKVSAFSFQAGDSILLQGGQTFSGKIYLSQDDKGSASNPIKVGSYGTGRATINAGSSSGLYAYDTGGIFVSNLNIVGAGRTVNLTGGINFFNDLAGGVKLEHVYIDQVSVSGFRYGILIGGGNGSSAYKDVRITNASVHDNAKSGIFTYAALPNANQSVYVGHVKAYNNTGVPFPAGTVATEISGHGIILANVNGATIERCVAHDNGALGEGGAGIWTYDSTHVTIQRNESYHNHTAGLHDGDGFDLDQNTSYSLVQYNYSHGNDGAGYIMASKFAGTAQTNNTVRYNVSQNDGRKNSFGALHIWGAIHNAEWYNNTIYISPGATGSRYGVKIHNAGIPLNDVSSVHFRNNIFVTTGGVPLVYVSADQLNGATDLKFQGNDYFATGASFQINWGTASYTSLSSWRSATGAERLNSANTGFSVDPQLILPGGGQTFGNADLLGGLTAYKLKSTSPLIDRGLPMYSTFGISSGGKDFLGTTLFQRGGYDLGAFELI